jgi:hypothetical protein
VCSVRRCRVWGSPEFWGLESGTRGRACSWRVVGCGCASGCAACASVGCRWEGWKCSICSLSGYGHGTCWVGAERRMISRCCDAIVGAGWARCASHRWSEEWVLHSQHSNDFPEFTTQLVWQLTTCVLVLVRVPVRALWSKSTSASYVPTHKRQTTFTGDEDAKSNPHVVSQGTSQGLRE